MVSLAASETERDTNHRPSCYKLLWRRRDFERQIPSGNISLIFVMLTIMATQFPVPGTWGPTVLCGARCTWCSAERMGLVSSCTSHYFLSLFFVCKLQKSKSERAALPSFFPADFIPLIKAKISRPGLFNREGLTQSRLFVCRHNWGEDSFGNSAS